MKVDFKETVWESIEVNDDVADQILEDIKSGKISSVADLYNEYGDDCLDSEVLLETSEQMTIEENEGNATIEVRKGKETVYSNV